MIILSFYLKLCPHSSGYGKCNWKMLWMSMFALPIFNVFFMLFLACSVLELVQYMKNQE